MDALYTVDQFYAKNKLVGPDHKPSTNIHSAFFEEPKTGRMI